MACRDRCITPLYRNREILHGVVPNMTLPRGGSSHRALPASSPFYAFGRTRTSLGQTQPRMPSRGWNATEWTTLRSGPRNKCFLPSCSATFAPSSLPESDCRRQCTRSRTTMAMRHFSPEIDPLMPALPSKSDKLSTWATNAFADYTSERLANSHAMPIWDNPTATRTTNCPPSQPPRNAAEGTRPILSDAQGSPKLRASLSPSPSVGSLLSSSERRRSRSCRRRATSRAAAQGPKWLASCAPSPSFSSAASAAQGALPHSPGQSDGRLVLKRGRVLVSRMARCFLCPFVFFLPECVFVCQSLSCCLPAK